MKILFKLHRDNVLSHVCALDRGLYAINGVSLLGDQAVSTDGSILMVTELLGGEIPKSVNRGQRLIVDPYRSRAILRAYTTKKCPTVDVLKVSKNSITARGLHGDFDIPLLEGDYPNWEDVVPKQSEYRFETDRLLVAIVPKLLASILKASQPFAPEFDAIAFAFPGFEQHPQTILWKRGAAWGCLMPILNTTFDFNPLLSHLLEASDDHD